MKSICLFLMIVLMNSNVNAEAGLPSWSRAREVMEECYSGWDAVIKVTAGLGTEYSLSSKSNKNDFKTISYSSSENESFSEMNASDEISTSTVFDIENDMQEGLKGAGSELHSAGLKHKAYAGIELSIPLYSREKRLSRQESTNRQVNALADLYAKYEGYRATVLAIDKEEKVLKRVMLDGGQAAISAYFGMLSEKEKSRALMISSKRKILMILESCGYGG